MRAEGPLSLLSSRVIRNVSLAAALVLSPAVAGAEIIDFTGMGRRSTVSVAGVYTGTVYAGELNWTWIGAAPEGFAQTFYTYCVDLLNLVVDPQTVVVGSSSSQPGAGAGRAAWLFNMYAPSVRASGTNTQAAALQVAIWEALYDSSGDLGLGNFRLTTTGAIRDQANAYLASLYYAPGAYHTSVATWLDTARGQDQITARVSEPPTLLLFGLSLLLFAGRLRRPASV